MRTSQKLKIFAVKKFGTMAKLAEAMGISQAQISPYTTGKRNLGSIQIARLRELGCDINWLMSEDDEPMPEPNGISYDYETGKQVDTNQKNVNRALREAYGKRLEFWIKARYSTQQEAAAEIGISLELLKQYMSGRKNATELSDKLIPLGFDMKWIREGIRTEIIGNVGLFKGHWYPVISTVQAGEPDFLYKEENILGWFPVDYKKELNCYMVLVEGESMTGGNTPIYDGDLVLIDMDIPPVKGELVVIIVAGRQMLKQYLNTEEENIILRSYNEDKDTYPDLVYPKRDVELMHRVVRICRKSIVV